MEQRVSYLLFLFILFFPSEAYSIPVLQVEKTILGGPPRIVGTDEIPFQIYCNTLSREHSVWSCFLTGRSLSENTSLLPGRCQGTGDTFNYPPAGEGEARAWLRHRRSRQPLPARARRRQGPLPQSHSPHWPVTQTPV